MPRRLTAAFLMLPLVLACRREQAKSEPTDSASKVQEVVDAGCPHQVDGVCGQGPTPQEDEGGADEPQLYGAPLGDSPKVEFEALVLTPDKYHQKKVRVEGHVRRACSRRGCWMEIAQDETERSPGFRVTFKDYGFLVPTDSAGSRAELEGTVQLTRVKKQAVQHYESEGAQFAEKEEDGSAREIRIVATGVELERS